MSEYRKFAAASQTWSTQRPYDVSDDGKHLILANPPVAGDQVPIIVILNWPALKK
jgi:hypothetical protein